MKSRSWFIWPLLFAMGCSLVGPNTPVIPGTSTSLPDPSTTIESAPDAAGAAQAYLDAWGRFNYPAMYAMLTTLSQDSISLEDFTARYANVTDEASLVGVSYEILQSLINPTDAQVAYRVTLNSAIFGAIPRETSMQLSRLPGQDWRVVWDERIILPELAGGNVLSLDQQTPSRGNIYDRAGSALVTDAEAVALGAIPSLIGENEGNSFVSQVSTLVGWPPAYLNSIVFAEDAAYYIPLPEVSADVFNQRLDFVSGFAGIRYQYYNTRLFHLGSAGSQALGYYGPIPAEEVDQWRQLGYQIDDYVGRIGLESYAEEELAGKRGGTLYVLDSFGARVTVLASADAQPSSSIYTTLDKELQRQAQFAIKDFTGAIVVLERDTGRILAMASSPGFNPNAADVNNYNSSVEWPTYFEADSNNPFLNRATQGQYPPGSIFKVVTLAAALESGLFTPLSDFYCAHTWNGLAGITLEDWTLGKELPESGQLSLLQGLMRSCNPWFYQIGLTLYNQAENSNAVAEMARGFGLGSLTGIVELPEVAGQIVDPADDPNSGTPGVSLAVQQAIGQGSTLITPLQAALYIAAVGNGGTLYRPQLIERTEDPNGQSLQVFEPQINGILPVSPENLQAIQTALRLVVNDPRGTAYRRFANFSIPVFAKTGTASNTFDPHAWFIGYTNAGGSRPDIAIAVIVENVGDGSEFAAPMFRRLVEVYFFGRPQSLFPWELEIGVLDPAYFEEVTEEEATATAEAGVTVLTPQP